MGQIIQLTQNKDFKRGLLVDQVKTRLDAKVRANEPLSALEHDLSLLTNINLLSNEDKETLVKRLSKLNLLSDGMSNPKTAKDAGLDNYINMILHLSPSDLSGFNICPMASKGCRSACLNGAGRGLFDSVQLPRLRKTLYYVHFRAEFMMHVHKEISKLETKNKGKRIIVRLNGTSDISWENIIVNSSLGENIFEMHPSVTFYDYTKVFSRLAKIKDIPNYHVTFSVSESNWDDAVKALHLGINVATVFKDVPLTYMGFKVIDGDKHDFRFLDPKAAIGYVVGLKAKGPAKRDTSGFVKVAV